MKGDFSRLTFDKTRHYSGVRMQQGRVQLDSDWNEQLDITSHRLQTETLDTVGPSGGPLAHAGFRLVPTLSALPAQEQARPENQSPPALKGAGDFYIPAGRYYVEGVLCENERIVPFTQQAELPGQEPVTQSGTYAAYLDVWQRHLTALEDPGIREVALGGPDTATRLKTVWQVKLLRVGELGDVLTCLSELPVLNEALEAPTGRLKARAEAGGTSNDPCIVPPGAGYRRLENQLYRVEVHTGGELGAATFKWSRDNGAVVTRWETQSGNKITVSSTGRDEVLQLAAGMWVELLDDERELRGEPGTLVRIASVNERVLTLDPATAIGPLTLSSFKTNPKVRRWDSVGMLQPTNSDWLELEDGVQVSLTSGSYRTGDFWLIPARTHTGDVEWPRDPVTQDRLPLAPHGTHHRYARLALMRFNGSAWTGVDDCRRLFPPLTELLELSYLGGDGQEALPGTVLDAPLRVGVSNGQAPVAGMRVRFRRLSASGALLPGGGTEESSNGQERVVLTGANGTAEVKWQLGSAPVTQVVEAALLDVASQVVHLPIHFTARTSIASQVSYNPKSCTALADKTTVQAALETLSAQTMLLAYAGDGQKTWHGQELPKRVVVLVTNACGPVVGAQVRFTPEGNGRVAAQANGLPNTPPGPKDVLTDGSGLAGVAWALDDDPTLHTQQLKATLLSAGPHPLRTPTEHTFTASTGEGPCHDFLDDLRSDGVVRNVDGNLSLEVQAGAAGAPGSINYTGGIAYVGGCRFLIPAGTLKLDLSVTPNRVAVNKEGKVVLLKDEPPPFATLADVDLHQNQLIRIIDRRLDLTHLDERVTRAEQQTATRRADRRAAIPLLAQTLPGLQYRDGRHRSFELPNAVNAAFDGQHIWVSTQNKTVARIPLDARSLDDVKQIDVGGPTQGVAYDGIGHIWFSQPGANKVISIDKRTLQLRSVAVGTKPGALVSDGALIWVANQDSRTLSVIDTSRHQVIRTASTLSQTPLAMAYDGEFVWVGCTSAVLFRVSQSTPVQQIVLSQLKTTITSLAFDGSQLWLAQAATQAIQRFDVNAVSASSSTSPLSAQATTVDAVAYLLLCDGERMWTVQNLTETFPLRAFLCATGASHGIALVNENIIHGGAFDGMHLWLTTPRGVSKVLVV